MSCGRLEPLLSLWQHRFRYPRGGQSTMVELEEKRRRLRRDSAELRQANEISPVLRLHLPVEEGS